MNSGIFQIGGGSAYGIPSWDSEQRRKAKHKKQQAKQRPSYYHKKVFTKQLDGTWDWEIFVWTKSGSFFADLVIKNPTQQGIGKFVSQEAATEDMERMIALLGLRLHGDPNK